MLMTLLFATIFLSVALLLHALTADKAKAEKQTLSRPNSISRAPQDPKVEQEDFTIRRVNAPGAIPWLDRLLSRLQDSAKLRLLLYQAGLNWSAARLVLSAAVAALAAGDLAYLRTGAALPALGCAAIGAAAPFLYVMRKRNVRLDRIRQLLPEALDLMVASLRAGHALSSAIGMAAKESPEPLRRAWCAAVFRAFAWSSCRGTRPRAWHCAVSSPSWGRRRRSMKRQWMPAADPPPRPMRHSTSASFDSGRDYHRRSLPGGRLVVEDVAGSERLPQHPQSGAGELACCFRAPREAPSPPYYGIVFFRDRAAPTANHSIGAGNGCLNLQGTLYITNTRATMLANATHYQRMTYSGTPCSATAVQGEIIAGAPQWSGARR